MQFPEEERSRFVLQQQPLVWSLVNRFPRAKQEKEELFQVGMVGLLKAADGFDETYGVKFSTYAVPVILGEIRRFLREDTSLKISRCIYEKQKLMRAVLEEKGELRMEELAAQTGLSMEEVVLAMEANRPVESLQKTMFAEAQDGILEERICGNEKSVEQLVEEETLLEQAMEHLQQEERQLLQLRYFENLPQREVGQRLCMSQVAVSRKEKKILEKMRQNL